MMKLTVIFGLIACAVTVYGEQCTMNSDCKSTLCNTGYHVVCEHKASTGVVANGGLCTCAQDDLSCVTREDCLKPTITLQCITEDHKHCYDNKCICTRW